MKIRNVVWISALVLVASALAGVGAPRLLHAETTDPANGTLSVVGTGVVKTTPDTATISAGVVTQATKAADAIDANAKAMTKVIDALKASGIDSKDLQTQFVSVDPRYDDTGQNLVGYNATNSVSATVRDLAKVGDVIDAAVAAGANNVSGPSLSRDDQDQLYRDALEDAVAKARLKATTLARAAGRSLGEIRVAERGERERGADAYDAFAAKAADVSTPIEAGTTAGHRLGARRLRALLAALDRQLGALLPLGPRAGIEPALAAGEREPVQRHAGGDARAAVRDEVAVGQCRTAARSTAR